MKNFADFFVHQDTSTMPERETNPASSSNAFNAPVQLQITLTSERDANNDERQSSNGTHHHGTPPSGVMKVEHTDDASVKGLHEALRAVSLRDGTNP
jgi:hypothetical protein